MVNRIFTLELCIMFLTLYTPRTSSKNTPKIRWIRRAILILCILYILIRHQLHSLYVHLHFVYWIQQLTTQPNVSRIKRSHIVYAPCGYWTRQFQFRSSIECPHGSCARISAPVKSLNYWLLHSIEMKINTLIWINKQIFLVDSTGIRTECNLFIYALLMGCFWSIIELIRFIRLLNSVDLWRAGGRALIQCLK